VKFVVRWKDDADADLAATWVNADSLERRKITAAARDIDRLLQSDPYAHSESREADRRIVFVAPLGATFRVDVRAQKVVVLRVWRFR